MSALPRHQNSYPRVYSSVANLFSGDAVSAELARIAAMGFDKLHLQGPIPPPRGLLAAASEAGLAPVLDLDVARVPARSPLVRKAPQLFAQVIDEAAAAVDPRRPDPTVMHPAPDADEGRLVDAVAAHANALIEAGAKGFIARSALLLPASFWTLLVDRIRAAAPDILLIVDALGGAPHAMRSLEGVGFDYRLGSVAWWDCRAGWFLAQEAELASVAPSIGFPEPPSGPRLAAGAEPGDPMIEARVRQRLHLAALASSGLIVPAGLEFGAAAPLDPEETRPGDLAHWRGYAPFDLSAELTALNASLKDLDLRGPIMPVTGPSDDAVALLRLSGGTAERSAKAAVVMLNPSEHVAAGVSAGPVLRAADGRFGDFVERDGIDTLVPGETVALEPLAVRMFQARRLDRAAPPVDEKAAKAALKLLAADRVAIEAVEPELDGGRFPVKRVVGDVLEVAADVFCDGHDKIAASLLIRHQDEKAFTEVPLEFVINDRWAASFPLTRIGRYVYTIQGWRDLFAAWRYEVAKKHDAGLDLSLELEEGRRLIEAAAKPAKGEAKKAMQATLAAIAEAADRPGDLLALMLDEAFGALMTTHGPRTNLSGYGRELEVVVCRTRAEFAAWYELMPRSMADDPTVHGTFRDVIEKLPYVQGMGFDVLYFTPIHPIGRVNRKGRNNSLTPAPDDPGSPYAIGSPEGGHNDLHPELGTFEDFAALVEAAHDHGLELALDFAIQCAPDHPWIKEHPEWFDWRPDGTIKFAENPPKKYEDIVNVHFYREALPDIWYELRDSVLFWVDKGVKLFRVDNPHTKPFPFWEWLIREVNDRHPDVVFLAEAFTRPKVMARLAKLGYQQSYSYFTWRNTKYELTEYLTELTQGPAKDYMRPNFFANTPDINPVYLQTGGRAGFQVRLVLASTLSTLYGLYCGYELCEATPVPGKEEYLDSEKYQIRKWDWDRPGHIRDDIRLLNGLRRNQPALQQFTNLTFLNAWNDNILCYAKATTDLSNMVLVAVNLDPNHVQSAHFEVPLWQYGLPDHASIGVEDLVTGARFTWAGKVQHVALDPHVRPYAIWRLIPPGRDH
jgi:starch synthase (maltosyl-transferring)